MRKPGAARRGVRFRGTTGGGAGETPVPAGIGGEDQKNSPPLILSSGELIGQAVGGGKPVNK